MFISIWGWISDHEFEKRPNKYIYDNNNDIKNNIITYKYIINDNYISYYIIYYYLFMVLLGPDSII